MKSENMLKQAILRGLLGIPIGITIGYLITIVISLVWGEGYYAPCVPELAEQMGSQIGAVLLQTALCALLGLILGSASIVWEIERLGLTRQTLLYFLILSASMLPIAYVLYWMEHSLAGFLQYLGIFVMIFVIIWVCQYTAVLYSLKKINKKLK